LLTMELLPLGVVVLVSLPTKEQTKIRNIAERVAGTDV